MSQSSEVELGNTVSNSKKYRNFCFTSFNGPIMFTNKMKYLLQGKEVCPKTDREHIQGFVIFKLQRSLKVVMRDNKGVHFEICKSGIKQNLDYCMKEGNYTEEGIRPTGQGSRTDVKKLGDLIREGWTDKEICEYEADDESDWCGTWVRNYKGIREARRVLDTKKRNWPMHVVIYWGKPGTGKTRLVYDLHGVDNVYPKMVGKWWDGYNQEPTVLIDDFDPSNCFDITFDFYLKLLDRYPMRVETKGGTCEFLSRTIIFTSNIDPDEWFLTKSNRDAFFRRVSLIKKIE